MEAQLDYNKCKFCKGRGKCLGRNQVQADSGLIEHDIRYRDRLNSLERTARNFVAFGCVIADELIEFARSETKRISSLFNSN